jgi:hypothetical protein
MSTISTTTTVKPKTTAKSAKSLKAAEAVLATPPRPPEPPTDASAPGLLAHWRSVADWLENDVHTDLHGEDAIDTGTDVLSAAYCDVVAAPCDSVAAAKAKLQLLLADYDMQGPCADDTPRPIIDQVAKFLESIAPPAQREDKSAGSPSKQALCAAANFEAGLHLLLVNQREHQLGDNDMVRAILAQTAQLLSAPATLNRPVPPESTIPTGPLADRWSERAAALAAYGRSEDENDIAYAAARVAEEAIFSTPCASLADAIPKLRLILHGLELGKTPYDQPALADVIAYLTEAEAAGAAWVGEDYRHGDPGSVTDPGRHLVAAE